MAESIADISVVRQSEHIGTLKDPKPHFDPPLTLWQGPIFRRLNKLSTDPQSAFHFLQSFLPIKDKALTLLQTFLSYGVVQLGGEYTHLKDHWFNNEKGWWPGQCVEEKMTRGLEEAFTKVNNTNLPLQCYWLIYDPYPSDSHVRNEVFVRITDPVKSPSVHNEGTYQDNGFSSILFLFCTPALKDWLHPA